MDINYDKIVEFILGKNKEGISNVLKEVLKKYCMISVDNNRRAVYLKSITTRNDFVMQRRKDGIIIIPLNSNSLTFGDDFEEMVEIRLNEDNDVVLSNITMMDNPKGICTTNSSWHNKGDNMYTESVARMMFFDSENAEALANRQSILMFLNHFDLKRNDIFHDLYWDMDSVRKGVFITPKINERIQINNGYDKEEFPALYKKFQDKIKELLNNNRFPKIF